MTDVVLVPGYWLGGWAWDRVAERLRGSGHSVWQVTLPGLGSADAPRREIRLEDHVAAVVELIRANDLRDVVLVAHSGSGAVVYGAIDRLPERVAHAVYVDSGPLPNGAANRPDLADSVVEIPLPSWSELADNGTSLEGLSPADLELFRRRAIPHPAGPARDPLILSNPARVQVPVTLVDCSIPSQVVREMTEAGNPWFTELARLQVSHVDLPTGHWPMLSRPVELAAILAAIAEEVPMTVGR